MKVLALLLSVILVVTLAPRSANAFCILEDRANFPQGPFAQFKTVPVRININEPFSSLAFTGLGGDSTDLSAEIQAVKTAIDIINSAGTNAPRLFFAGFVDSPGWGQFPPDLPDGILIGTFGSCAQETTNSQNFTVLALERHDISTKSKIGLRRGGQFACKPLTWWTDPDFDDDDPDDKGGTLDMVGVLVHEMLHSLGLGHTSDPEGDAKCDQNFARTPSSASVMFEGESPSRLFRRRLKRDDIEALRVLYGPVGRIAEFSTSTANPPLIGSWANQGPLQAGLQVNSPLTLSDAARELDERILAGLTNTSDQVAFLEGSWDTGWSGNPPGGTVVLDFDGFPARTWERVVTARGVPLGQSSLTQSREIFAFLGGNRPRCCAEEDVNGLQGRIHFRVRKEGVWLVPATAQSSSLTPYRSLGVSYDPRRDVFVLAYIDVCELSADQKSCLPTPDAPGNARVFVRTINASTGGGGCTQALTSVDQVHAVGDVSCDLRGVNTPSYCVIPVATAETLGPRLSFIQGQITEVDGFTCFVRTEFPLTRPLTALGAPSTAMNGAQSSGPMLIGHTPGFSGLAPQPSGYIQLFSMNRFGPNTVLDGNVNNARTFQTWMWPLHVGTMTRISGSQVRWHAITY